MPDDQPQPPVPPVDGQPAVQALQALLDWLRPLTAAAGPDDYFIFQAPPSLDQAGAIGLARLLSLQTAARGTEFQLVDASRRVQVIRLPETMPVRMQTTDLRDTGRPHG